MTRVLRLCGGEEAADDPRFQTAQGRVQHMEEVDGMVASWIAARGLDEVLAKFEEAEAAIGPLTIANRSSPIRSMWPAMTLSP